MNKLNKKAFTLIELIVVMAIIGILVLLAAPRFLGYTKDANVTAMKADAKMLSNISLQYNVENNAAWPTSAVLAEGLDDALEVKLGKLAGDATIVFETLDATKVSSQYKNLKNALSDYVIVTSAGEFQGEVFHLAGVADRGNVLHYGVSR